MKRRIRNQEIRFCVITLIWGILFAFLIPLWQVPDEYAHAEMIGQEIRNENLAAILLEEAHLDERRVRWNTEEKVNLETLEKTMWKTPQYDKADCLPKGISLKIVRHLPAAVGIQLGVMFRVPAYWVVILGRLFSLLFYIVVCNNALKQLPVKKELLELVMLLPICIQEAASLSYDAVLISLCFWLLSRSLHFRFTATRVGLCDILTIIGVLVCIALIKPPYIVLGGIFLIVPIQKMCLKFGKCMITGENIRKFRWQICIFVVAVIVLALYLERDNIWVRLVAATLMNFKRTFWLFGRTCKVWGEDIFCSMIGSFGYFSQPTTAAWFIAVVPAFILVISMTKLKRADTLEEGFLVRDKVIMYLVLACCFYLVTVSMISMTAGYDTRDWVKAMYEITYISGLQGRYYIPMLMLFLLPMPPILEMEEKVYKKIRIGYYILICVYTCIAVGDRYWIV